MSKRFTATEKWRDPWFLSLYWQDKLFWSYLLDNCDHAGIWQVYWPEVRLKISPDFEFRPNVFGDRIRVISDEKWWIPKFIEFQYGTLNPDNRAHLSVILILEREGLYKVLASPLQVAKDKDKDKDSVNRKLPTNETTPGKIPPSLEAVRSFCLERGKGVNADQWFDFYSSKGWMIGKNKMKDWKAAVRTWEKNTLTTEIKTKSEPPYFTPFPELKRMT